MQNSVKELILEYLQDESFEVRKKDKSLFTALSLAEKFFISRSLASHYLNELVKEGKLLKVNERPVSFYHFDTIASLTSNTPKMEYASFKDLELELIDNSANFSDVIGAEYSLKVCFDQIKTALNYMSNGLPFILQGKKGTGKKYICEKLYQYCQGTNIIDLKSNYLYLSCDEYDQQQLEKMLFGKESILTSGKYGLIVFDKMKSMSLILQSRLADFIDSNVFTSEKVIGLRFVFVCEDLIQIEFSNKLLSKLLSVVTIPSLKERTVYEKEMLILHFASIEQRKTQKPVTITNYFMELLISMDFDNIGSLKNAVVQAFAKAYASGNKVCLNVASIPDELKYNYSFHDKEVEYSLNDFKFSNQSASDKIYEAILSDGLAYYGSTRLGKMYDELKQDINHFNDYIIFKLPNFSNNLNRYETIVSNIANIVETKLNVKLSNSYKNLMVRTLYCQSIENKLVHEFCQKNIDKLNDLTSFVFKTENLESQIFSEIAKLLMETYSIDLNSFLRIILILNMKFERKAFNNSHSTGLLICHGYSTASSIANAVNNLIGQQVFTAFDMPLDVKMSEVVNQIDEYLKERKFVENVLILVDMGSLEMIGNMIKNRYDINIGIINNITTSMALNIGYGIVHEQPIDEILRKASEENICKYNIIHKRTKQKAIIFTSESGTVIAEKFRKLFEDSIPVTIPIQFLSFDYYQLMNSVKRTELLNSYEILFVAGTMDPKFQRIDFIDLGDIVNLSAISRINEIFTGYISKEEIERFNEDLLKNFSLTNVIESVTILNPKPLLDAVFEAVRELERLQASKIDPKALVGLYVHICCFVERMVMRIPVKTYPDLEQFIKHHGDFIELVRNACVHLAEQYGIDIPASEVGYIYDYIRLVTDDNIEYEDE